MEEKIVRVGDRVAWAERNLEAGETVQKLIEILKWVMEERAGACLFRVIAHCNVPYNGKRQARVKVAFRASKFPMPDGNEWWPAYWFEKI
jgi:hypothetical protein